MSEIKLIATYEVDGESFKTREEAERYLCEKEKDSLLSNPIYKNSLFRSTSFYEHYIYDGAEHESRKCVGRFTTLREALEHMPNYRNSMGKNGSGVIDFVKITENDGAQGFVEVERNTIISVV